jgi:putative methyltransferase
MSKEVLKNIGRQNISIEYYSELMRMYNEAGVATYTELILGLPGETYKSIVEGIDELLRLGQHNSIYIHNCEWLPCSIMGQKDYMEKYSIKTSRIPLNQPHREPDEDDDIQEWSQVVTSTYSMSSEEWKKMNLFSYVVQAYHHMGLLQFFALYLYNEGICSYKNFYTGLLTHLLNNPDSVAGGIFTRVSEFLEKVLAEKGTLSCCDERFGRVQWPFEEYIYLCTVYESDKFYSEIADFLKQLNIDEILFKQLLDFQKNIIKKPFDTEVTVKSEYDFLTYFNSLLDGKQAELKKKEIFSHFRVRPFENWEMYAKKVVWYGRKDSSCTYIKTAQSERSKNND